MRLRPYPISVEIVDNKCNILSSSTVKEIIIPTFGWIFSENALLGILFDLCYIDSIEDASNEY